MYQFVHVESYSRTAPKTAESQNKKTGKASGKAGRSVKWIVDEAIRDPNAHPHVDNPLPPTYLYGEPLEQLEATCEAWAATMTDSKGRKLRKDALCLAAGVVSAPDDIEPEAWASFKSGALDWLKAKYGDDLRTVIEHTDESHPHLHFYCVPQLGQRFETVHQGKAAAADAKAQGKLKGLQNKAYKAAMREFQDEFYDAVGIEHGFTRIGPARRRLTREEWKLEQIQAAAAARAIEVARESVEASAEQGAALIADAKAKAIDVAATALEKADAVEREAEKRGFEQGIAATDSLPWWQRVKLFVGSIVKERDTLRVALETISVERDQLVVEKESILDRLAKAISLGKPWELRANRFEARLLKAELDAEAGKVAVAQRDDLVEALDRAEDRAKHWEAVAEAHMPKPVPVMGIPGKKPKLTQGIDLAPPGG